jgi:hypothetical protein
VATRFSYRKDEEITAKMSRPNMSIRLSAVQSAPKSCYLMDGARSGRFFCPMMFSVSNPARATTSRRQRSSTPAIDW